MPCQVTGLFSSSVCIHDRLLENYVNQSICRVVEVIHANESNKVFGDSSRRIPDTESNNLLCAISDVLQSQIGSESRAQNF